MRRSSPGTYGRKSASSTPRPRARERRSPGRSPIDGSGAATRSASSPANIVRSIFNSALPFGSAARSNASELATSLALWHRGDDIGDERIGGHAVERGVERQDHAMAQHGRRDGDQVV